jgi:hypothetical protein
MAVVLQFHLCLYELQRLVINVDDRLLSQECNVSIDDRLVQLNTFTFMGGIFPYII